MFDENTSGKILFRLLGGILELQKIVRSKIGSNSTEYDY